MKQKVFISVGTALTAAQNDVADIIFQTIKAAGLDPRQMEKNEWSYDQPLRAIRRVLRECDGAVVIAFSRTSFETGMELTRSGGEDLLSSIRLPTVWNQIEAAMAHMHEIPLLVIAERGLREEGLLEGRYDWKVFWTDLGASEFKTDAFQGFLETWKDAVSEKVQAQSTQIVGEQLDLSTGHL